MIAFLGKFQSFGMKFARVNSIRMINLSIYFNFLCAVPRGDVIKRTRFLMRPPVVIPLWYPLSNISNINNNSIHCLDYVVVVSTEKLVTVKQYKLIKKNKIKNLLSTT